MSTLNRHPRRHSGFALFMWISNPQKMQPEHYHLLYTFTQSGVKRRSNFVKPPGRCDWYAWYPPTYVLRGAAAAASRRNCNQFRQGRLPLIKRMYVRMYVCTRRCFERQSMHVPCKDQKKKKKRGGKKRVPIHRSSTNRNMQQTEKHVASSRSRRPPHHRYIYRALGEEDAHVPSFLSRRRTHAVELNA